MADEKAQDGIDDRALAMMASANDLIGEGRQRDAAAMLEEAAHLHEEAGRPYDQARCLQLAATLRRSAGDTDLAKSLAQQAAGLRVDDGPLSVSIAAETAEIATAESRFEDAVAGWTDAIEKGTRAGLRTDEVSAFVRRRAANLIELCRFGDAEADFIRAFDLTRSAHGEDVAAFILIEEANHLCDAGEASLARAVADRVAILTARESSSAHLRGELQVLLARLAKDTGDLKAMETHAAKARALGREAVAPLTYFSASVQLADAFQLHGERTQAYRTLATTWATLGDLLGPDVAASWVQPCLQAFQLSWGDDAFQEAKSQYEASRRAEIKRNQHP
jgi:tetratricopeptide (TPR) repeat protein